MAEHDDLTAAGAGVRTAIDEAGGPGDPPVPQATQLPLLPAEQLDALPEGQNRRLAIQQAPRRGPGRPPGARNKSTTAWRDFILARYPSPLVALAETYSRSAQDLAAELSCKPLEAMQIQMRAATELAPYLHGKMPVEVQISGQLPVLHLVAPADAVALFEAQRTAEEGDGTLVDLSALQPVEIVENQGLDGAASGEVERSQSNGSAESCGNAGFPGSEPLIADQSEDGR